MRWMLAVLGLLTACARAGDETLVLDWLDACEACRTVVEDPGPRPTPARDPWTRGLRPEVETTHDGRPFRWSRGAESRFTLTALSTRGRSLLLDGFPAPSPDPEPQVVEVFVQGAWVGRLDWDGPARRTLPLPDDVLSLGRNEVQLAYRYVVRPIDLRPASRDARDLAMAWHEVSLDASDASVRVRPTPTSGSTLWRTSGVAATDAEVAWWIDRAGAWEELHRQTLSADEAFEHALTIEGEPGSVGLLGLAVLAGEVRWTEVSTRTHAVDRRPVVLITLDTTRRDALGSYAEGPVTPALDRLAAEGVVWDEAYAPTPTTAPTHASLFLARWPAEHGLKINGHPLPRAGGENAVVQAQAWGYDTAAFVSLGVLARDLAFDQGWNVFDDHLDRRWWRFAAETNRKALSWIDEHPQGTGRAPGFLWVHYSDPHKPYGVLDEEGQPVIVELNGVVVDTMATMGLDESCAVSLRAGRNEIRLTSMSLPDDEREHWYVFRGGRAGDHDVRPASGWDLVKGHSRMRESATMFVDVPRAQAVPLTLTLEDLPTATEARRRYAQEVTAVDQAVGDLLDRLESKGWLERGLVMVVADHGEDLGEGGHFGHVEHVGPTLTRVPMILWSRGMTPLRLKHHVSVIDVMPTLWALQGLPAPPAWTGQDARIPVGGRILRLETFPPEAERHWRGVVTPTAQLARIVGDGSGFVGIDGSPLESFPQAATRAWSDWPGDGAEGLGQPDPSLQERLRALGYAN